MKATTADRQSCAAKYLTLTDITHNMKLTNKSEADRQLQTSGDEPTSRTETDIDVGEVDETNVSPD